MSKYDNEALHELCSKFDLLEYVEQNYEVKKISGRYYTHCPLHSDLTPSLCINPDNTFHCFSCKEHGSPIDWFKKIEKKSWNESLDIIQKYVGEEVLNLKICETLALYKNIKKMKEKKEKKEVKREILPFSFYDKFSKDIPEEWVKEGISPQVMKEYDIRIDHESNRIVYPIYDNENHLIGCKGRTRFKNFKELGIPKYMNYKSVFKWDFFVGMANNIDDILSSNSVIIFEGIKSGLKLTTYTGKRNWLSAETSYVNDDQVNILIKMGVKDITIAFDSDVEIEQVKKCTDILKRFSNVYVIINHNNILGEKESPIDRGIGVFNDLFRTRIKMR